ncbi:MAG: twin-arginine translocation signal domain-containing protein [Prolixibacteraceae bacterium]|jgi:sugar phosphate isomerase/epimerase|nr:twin-arginine translocation signal domain-containing protein [Prolixibacteraceae bacterium]MBT6765037.1 twin-arginine translocation signal domain-containing protein [Prolixibacteraceae bacterium]MBT6999092.1 twin-arginine translocation signal domain-containing protein [Prolixibacteraceae bacterium]MBT7396168.1 twin-arginine translocation signal domain-containing protein [Prolixibacteraceae bacterium]
MKNPAISRRKFLGTTAAAAAGISVVPFNYSCTNKKKGKKPNSKVNGVQLGLTTYSYRSIPNGLEEVLGYVLKAGVNALEMRRVLEEGLGIPQGPPRAPRGVKLTDQEKAERAAAADAAREEQRQWRLSLPMQKYADIRKMYNDAGVDLHIVKFAPSKWSDEEIDYAYEATKVLGAYGITDEASEFACKRLGKFAEKHDSLAIYHTHGQFGDHGFDLDTLLGYSPANRLNLDVGHYYGATGKHPNEIIEKYHDQIPMIHVKDKTGPNHDTPNANRPFGEGETPIADVLLLLKEEQWPIDVFVELEYKIADDSDPVKEVIKCIEYMRNILE